MKAPGSASNRNTSSTRTAVRSASPSRATRLRRARTTPASATRTSATIAREIVEEHLDLCLEAGINHEGINAEVAKGQWEFQIFGKGSKKAADEMWMARYLLQRLTEKYGIDIEFHCKPLGDTDWNGSGMHANFSTEYMREVGGKAYFEALMAQFDKNLMDHIAVYGPDNDKRLTGKHETAPWNKFSYGVADRGASIRVPHSSSRTTTRAIWKTAVRTPRATPTRSLRRS
jgi:glutamine synthetase